MKGKIISLNVSMYEADISRIDEMMRILSESGFTMSRSALVRLAIARLDVNQLNGGNK